MEGEGECVSVFLLACVCLCNNKSVPLVPSQVVKDTVNIQIGDVNDNSPTFHGQLYTVHIAEVGYSHVQYVCVVV